MHCDETNDLISKGVASNFWILAALLAWLGRIVLPIVKNIFPKRSVLVLKSPNVAFSLIHSISYLHSSMQWRHDWSFDDVTADLSTGLPDFALVLRVHRGPDRTLEDVGKLLRVGENPDDPEAGRGVRVFQNLELVGLRGGSRAPDL